MTVLIKNALVFDGSGKPPFKSDIFINRQRIGRLGDFSLNSAEKKIDARGTMVTPGFININSDSDHNLSLFSDTSQSQLLKYGITTIIGGNTGSSLAPLIDGSLRSVRKWAEPSLINVNWRSVGEFLRVLEQRKLGVNFGTLIGHSTIRRAIIGEELRDLTEKELKVFNYVLETGLKEGAFGFSTGLTYVHSHNVSYKEIEKLAKTTVKFKAVYATQLRNYTDGLVKAINETLNLARNTDVNTQINYFQPLINYGEDYLKIISLIEKEKNRAHIHFDLNFNEASLMEIYTFLPEWVRNGGLEIILKNIATPNIRERLLKTLENFKPEDLVVAQTPANLKFLIGKSLKQLSEDQDINPVEALLKLMELTQLKAGLWYKNVDSWALRQALISENAIIASKETVKFLNLINQENLMPLEKAIVKMTSLPARKFNIKERGLIAEGYYADLVVFRDGQPSEVLVNGSVVLENGEPKGVLAGKILRHQ
jgi:N-acyl-D-aspartate/D-glutamate deacylase